MIAISYTVSRSMAKLGKPFSRAALLCGVYLLLITSCTNTASTEAEQTPQLAAFTIVTCMQDDPADPPTVANVDPAGPLEECASGNSCGECITAILNDLSSLDTGEATPQPQVTPPHNHIIAIGNAPNIIIYGITSNR